MTFIVFTSANINRYCVISVKFIRVFSFPALEWAQQYLDRGNDQMSIVDNMNSQLDLVREKLYDLQNNTRHSLDNSQATIDMNIRNRALMETIRVSNVW